MTTADCGSEPRNPGAQPGFGAGADFFAKRLEHWQNRLAVVTEDGERVTYSQLARRADAFAHALGAGRRLLMLECANQIEPLVAYLGALRAGHPVLMAPADAGGRFGQVAETYRPGARYGRQAGRWTLTASDDEPPPLHPELAVLLSTSGSTGSAKLVRLSYGAVQANARSISQYLDISPDDRAITSLPIHYSYGLSVVTSHLARGAALLLTERSVIEEPFFGFFDAQQGTCIAGVPYTYELLERTGFRSRALPTLRHMTQAGGRLPPETARTYADWAQARGVQFFIMYGQTEATARMAYLPPELAARHPDAIGIAIPGGSFRILDAEGNALNQPDQVGELAYSGPNLMMGYATGRDDLARGPEVEELRTGDLAVRDREGLYRIVGRQSRFSKIYGLRISSDEIEAFLQRRQIASAVAADDEVIAVAYRPGPTPAELAASLADALGMPTAAIVALPMEDLPRSASGKMDYPAILALAKQPVQATPATPQDAQAAALSAFHRTFPGSRVGMDDTFVTLGGDSLSYVMMSMELDAHLGFLPDGWENLSVAALAALARPAQPGRSRWRLKSMESEVLVRCLAIIAVVITHASGLVVSGGADVLLMLVGFNFARYQRRRIEEGRVFATVADVAVRIIGPYYLMLLVYGLYKGQVDVPSLLLISNFWGRFGGLLEPYWFLEALMQCILILAAALSFKPLRNQAAHAPWAFGLGMLAAALAVKVAAYGLLHHDALENRTPDSLFYLLGLGWCAWHAVSLRQRLLLTAIAGMLALLDVGGPGGLWFKFGAMAGATHAAWLFTSVCLLLWAPRLRLPGPVHKVVGAIAAASFYIYLTHGVPVHLLETTLGVTNLAVVLLLSICSGVLSWWLLKTATAATRRAAALPRA